jgi:hypothetical protein
MAEDDKKGMVPGLRAENIMKAVQEKKFLAGQRKAIRCGYSFVGSACTQRCQAVIFPQPGPARAAKDGDLPPASVAGKTRVRVARIPVHIFP